MAGIRAQLFAFATFLSVLFLSASVVVATTTDDLLNDLQLIKAEKLSHFRVYMHDLVGGENASAVEIIPPISATSSSSFGLVRMIDNPLTEGPELESKLWGKAQGLYAAASREDISLLMAMSFAFVSGEYNGSSVAIMGRNPIEEKVRELPVIGGSGAFRLARGFATATTVEFDPISTSAVIQYDLFILHY